MSRLLIFALACLLPFAAQAGNVYKYTDRNGVTVYTNIKPRGVAKMKIIRVYCPACDVTSTVDWTATGLNIEAFKDEIRKRAAEEGVDEALVRAVIHAESAFNPRALSPAGAQGLMQLIPSTAAIYKVQNSYDAGENIRGGVRHLRMLIDLFDGDLKLVTAGYNAGENAVLRWGGVPPYDETQVYVQRVAILHQRYRQELGLDAPKTTDGPALAANTP
ncbi:MAG: lytic transglycosylase domain-containing protein [Xanthomonadales bacterium]|nr:lytic transglycosylase domain-containing protein [Xanthomonadales bacterium]MCB1642425.1 lytic transglycosylase domain-containing protein [Xanthomonadales bacterium]